MDKEIFLPGKITEYLFCGLLLVFIGGGIVSTLASNMQNLSSGEINLQVGYPLTLFSLNTLETEKIPIKWSGLILDLLIYLVAAYLIEILVKIVGRVIAKEKDPPNKDEDLEIMKQAKIAYDYYILQGISEQNLTEMFKNRGWSDEGISKLKEMK